MKCNIRNDLCRGLFISLYDKGNIKSILKSWPEIDVKVRVYVDLIYD